MDTFDVTVIVVTYNSDFDKISRTIKSIVLQININCQIIVSDDGSTYNFFNEIENLLLSYGFVNFKLIGDDKNKGTCSNVYKALKSADGMYTKLISPGDFFYSETTLSNWLNFLKSNNFKISFGKALYYHPDLRHTLVSYRLCPERTWLFNYEVNKKKFLFNYLVLQDNILGASTLSDTIVLKKYIGLINGKVQLAEDNAYRLMALDNIRPVYYDKFVIWYEYGTGVSTKTKSSGINIIKHDYQVTDKIMYERIESPHALFEVKLKKYLYINSKENSRIKVLKKNLLFPQKQFYKLLSRIRMRRTVTKGDIDSSFIDSFY